MLLNYGAGGDSWTARRSNLSILKEISPECSLGGQILKHRLQYFGHLMRREDSLEKNSDVGKIEGTRRRGRQRTRWLDSVLEATKMSLTKLREAVEDRSAWCALVRGVTKSRTQLNNNCSSSEDLRIITCPGRIITCPETRFLASSAWVILSPKVYFKKIKPLSSSGKRDSSKQCFCVIFMSKIPLHIDVFLT
ncbi:Hypothetical predicted protein [Podarcis lilfordi]|uniref:Uncharacterized protein n=1 Tax=Podarcis lilfordi TaxID=74358 RepID=A0AA35JUI5_9SAUR|nr:Hypothetical predicted protein [Podarcis lilfordi]